MLDMTIISSLVAVAVLTVLVILVRSLARILERYVDGNISKPTSPEDSERILTNAVNEALKLQEDRARKRVKRPGVGTNIEDLTDEEIETILEQRHQEGG